MSYPPYAAEGFCCGKNLKDDATDKYRAKMLGIEKYTIKWFTNDEAVNKKHKPFTFPREIGKK